MKKCLLLFYFAGFCIFVFGCSNNDNAAPVIDELIGPETIKQGESVSFQAVARDPDGDTLTYTWWVNGALLVGVVGDTTPSTPWSTITEAGNITIEVHVSDGANTVIEKKIISIIRQSVSLESETIPEEFTAFSQILRRWSESYQNEDIHSYTGVFWSDDFLYQSDMGTDTDPTDDVIFNDIQDEIESATYIFEHLRNIKIEIEISISPEHSTIIDQKAIINTHYRIQAFVPEGTSIQGGYAAYFAEGDADFSFEDREGEWRITKWVDRALRPEEIQQEYSTGSFPTMWVDIKKPRIIDNEDGEDRVPPKITGGSVKNRDTGVDPDLLNSNGIEITFDEDINGNAQLFGFVGDLGWESQVIGNTLILDRRDIGEKLAHEVEYEIKGNVRDAAGNETQFEIIFTTKALE